MRRFLRTTAGKGLLFFLVILTLFALTACVLGILFMAEKNVYFSSEEEILSELEMTPDPRLRQLVILGYNLRYDLYWIGALALLLAAACFVALMCVSGRRPDREDLVPGALHPVPIDLLAAIALFVSASALHLLSDQWWWGDAATVLAVLLWGLTTACMALGLCMSIACRIKDRSLFRNTVIWRCCKLCLQLLMLLWRGVKWFFRGLRGFFRFLGRGMGRLPLIWRSCLLIGGLCVLDLIMMGACWWEMDNYMAFWFLSRLVLVPAALYAALMLRRLQKGGAALAAGDLSYQVNTRRMFWDFKRHGEDLNSIALGMSRAVDERMKSERMKTELITNVSHDIKTPLTSIINYADLIGREECDNPVIREYAEVLSRQSDRLKRLIEDLVEASKASSGSLEVLLSPCEAAVFLTQIAGEYQQKLEDAGLELITRTPENPLRVLADGRRMLRVFDNLMNNICKYAQRGTRVYLTLEQQGEEAVITFRNVSREPLNVAAEELMERFVRGDASRSSEGNGLGLSIARSLTELQKGRFDIAVDGDLFKVTLRFPLLA